MKSSGILIAGIMLMVLGCDRDHSIENEEEIEISSDSSDSNYVTNKWETINKSLNQYTKENPSRPMIVYFGADW